MMRDVLLEHFEELDFLWEQRERFVFAHDWTLQTLSDVEERAEAHLDGLRLGGEQALALARPFLVGEETGAATAAAFTLLASEDPQRISEVLDACTIVPPATLDGLRIALRHGGPSFIEDRLHEFAVAHDARLQALAADVLAFHRQRPPELEGLFEHDDPAIRARAFGAAGRVGKILALRHVRRALDDTESAVRSMALHAAAQAGLADVASLSRARARQFEPVVDVVEFLGVVGERDDVPVLEQALREPVLAPAALQAMADLGMPEIIPAVLREMETPALGDAAAAAFAQITGIEVPRRHASPVATPEEEGEPPPDASRAAASWETVRRRFERGHRYQHGQDVDAQPLAVSLHSLPLRSRRTVYLRHRLRDPAGTPDLELEARVYDPPKPLPRG